jgi:hypothetical protein
LVKNLYDEEKVTNDEGKETYANRHKKLYIWKKEFPLQYEVLCKKGHYPYEWVDSEDKLKFEGLPERSQFYSKLTQQDLTEEEYKHAQFVYEITNCKTFLDYHLIYLKNRCYTTCGCVWKL